MALVTKSFSDIITFTRTGTTATYFNSAGVLVNAGADVPRLDYNPATLAAQGLLIEEARTNSIRNNTMQGAVAGTPGTPPTNWSLLGLSGLTQQIVGTGTESGINYIDVRVSGTTTSALFYVIRSEGPAFVAATNGQTWTSSHYVRLVGGSLTNLTQINHVIQYSDAVGAPLTYGVGGITPTGAALNTQRFIRTTTASSASTAFVVGYVQLEANSGVAIDITLRIGLPQLERGAFATSVIPTVNAFALGVTREADVANVNTLAPWYNAAEGTLYVQAQDMSDAAHATSQPRAASLNDGTTSNTVDISRVPASAQGRARIEVGGANQFNSLTTAWPLATQAKVALAYKANDYAACLGGGTVFTNTTSSLIPTVTALSIGDIRTTFSNHWVGWIQRVAYYPRRLSNAELQAITA